MATPKLRFKEFDGNWQSVHLDSVVTFKKGKGISKADIIEDGANYCIRYGELYTTYGQVIRKVFSKTNIPKSESVLSKAGDVIIPASGETQIDIATASCVLESDIILSGDLNILSHSEVGEWLAYYLSSAKKLEIAQLAQGNSVVHLYSSQLKDLKINKPSKEEQTKIASFLSAGDEKISQLTQKHELLSQYKQGMMQKLFSQQIRFKADDGSEFGEWEETKFGDIASKVGSGSTPRGGAEAYETDGIIFIRSQNVNNDQLLLNDVVYISEETHKKMSGSKVIANDILLNITGASIGRSCVVPQTFTEANVNQHVCIIRTPNDNPRFIQSFLSSKAGQDLIDSHQTGSGREGLNFQSIRSFVFQRPCLAEQIKIANFLSAIDQKIEVVAQQIEQAKQWKKGLLQQMFV
ncbi:restriction endonuclease subunit S [Acinetobacter baumannii]